MIVAILGWGSLIWDPRNLQIDTTKGVRGWIEGGPLLPIEFARISNDGRLTLVIAPNEDHEIATLYAFSKYQEVDEAILDLAVREGCGKNRIGVYIKHIDQFSNNFLSKKFQQSRNRIIEWISQKEIGALIWTNLSVNYEEKLNQKFSKENVIGYLNFLSPDIQAKAEEYIRKAPKAVNTPIREEIEENLGWQRINVE